MVEALLLRDLRILERGASAFIHKPIWLLTGPRRAQYPKSGPSPAR